MSDPIWRPVLAELDRLAERGRSVALWLRDDDAVTVTPALRRLTELCDRHGLPILLAVIPEQADRELAAWVADHPILKPTQHGIRHANHAPAGERARELRGLRSLEETIEGLAFGRAKLSTLFGARAADILVPPWNRIDPDVLPFLPAIGFTGLSTCGEPGPVPAGLAALPCTLDIIDWRNGQVCRPHDKLALRLAALLAEHGREERPIGLLTHHLVHEEPAWLFLSDLLEQISDHPGLRFTAAEDLLGQAVSATGSTPVAPPA